MILPSSLPFRNDAIRSLQVCTPPVNPSTCMEIAINTAVSNRAVKMKPVTTHGFISKMASQLPRSPLEIRNALAMGGNSWERVVSHKRLKMMVTLWLFRYTARTRKTKRRELRIMERTINHSAIGTIFSQSLFGMS